MSNAPTDSDPCDDPEGWHRAEGTRQPAQWALDDRRLCDECLSLRSEAAQLMWRRIPTHG